ncbi:NADH-quinone oxidoreductase subunit L [Microbulbifer yueqingensis]|uniref:NADH-ubiquinone oxidoreductase chain 5 n=1 Tax=Microbulbifer yueqingensis TaxID=658219 RepID=A0A1G8WX99_9GAMM|nr:NADH-quinone oxidoreductase subunit L [Microbulbifer yueqingensis]SDJ82989.1 NADH dehydrogenase subunit L [Microbulbifer yueqingensis]
MNDIIGLIPLLPLLGFLVLALAPLFGNRELPEKVVAAIGVSTVGIAALLSFALMFSVFSGDWQASLQVPAWSWIRVGDLSLDFGFHVDGLTQVMLLVVTGVGFLIHLYSAGYMRGDAGYRRYFAYLNLFVCAMLLLVMADNLVLLYLGWEGVGLCSYLLIGFWYRNPGNGAAARKAFIVTRVGDTAMALGLFLLFREFATLDIGALNRAAGASTDIGIVTLAALLLLGGAVGKSAQLPLQTWLPDAMAGPTPVSALIHAATMVTAGVYLIARLHPLFSVSDTAMLAVGWVGALTLLSAGLSALVQTDIKRILAYSTISQIGYMFLALGVGAWSGAIFHLMTHAFFKALLFLAAGSVILSLHHEQDVTAMGGLRKKIPLTFACFAIGSACLAALPLTSGFYSKDQILLQAWETFQGFNLLWLAGIVGALVTGVYSFRLLFLVFFGREGKASQHCRDANSPVMSIPLVTLSLLALSGGLLAPPLQGVFPARDGSHAPLVVEGIAIAMPLLGLLTAWLMFSKGRNLLRPFNPLERFLFSGWGFDWLYDRILVRPLVWLANINSGDIVDSVYRGSAEASRRLHLLASQTQNGQVRWYLGSLAAGSILLLAILVVL